MFASSIVFLDKISHFTPSWGLASKDIIHLIPPTNATSSGTAAPHATHSDGASSQGQVASESDVKLFMLSLFYCVVLVKENNYFGT